MADETILRALRLLQSGDIAGAEQALASAACRDGANTAQAHYILGKIRLRQKQFAEAEASFRQAQGAGSCQKDLAAAFYELGCELHRSGQLDDAERVFSGLLEALPGPASLMLGAVLIDAKRPAEAEKVLRAALKPSAPKEFKAALYCNLALSLRRQRNDPDALANYNHALVLQPDLAELQIHRAEVLQNLGDNDAAIEAYRKALAIEPLNPAMHRLYNDLLDRLGREDDCLRSYDQVSKTRALQLEKARFLSQHSGGAEAQAIYEELLAQDAGDKVALTGRAGALALQKRYDEAAIAFEDTMKRFGEEPELLRRAAEVALFKEDPARALTYCEKGLAQALHDQQLLATKSAALRMMQDERDEQLCGYDSLIRTFDLPPPKGFLSLEAFHDELARSLAALHPGIRASSNQSLRGGTQTPDHLFGAGHELVERLEEHISQAVSRYIAELKSDQTHPFLSRRGGAFEYAGSWSSRLGDCGFHVNHIHPQGWISSCYYVSVPKEAQNQDTKQGWIKFGEPGLDLETRMPIRRYIQPLPGRLVLFPSYVWHGTTPFHSNAQRTTIAFDAVPVAR